jgi:DNA-directed RNA polymerase specialized sigma24 family protein
MKPHKPAKPTKRPARYQVPLGYFEMSPDEIAAALDISSRECKSILARALRKAQAAARAAGLDAHIAP